MRIKTLDIARGLIILGMVWVHLRTWWLRKEDAWFNDISRLLIDKIFGPAFIWLSGVSLILWYRNASIKAKELENYNARIMKKEYYFRALILLVIAFSYNIVVALVIYDITWIWAWFILLALAFSMLMSYPFFKTSKLFRLIYSFIIIIINQIIITILWSYEGQLNIYGILFHLLYYPLFLYPVLVSYAFYILGTVFGDLLFEVFQIEDIAKRRLALRNKIVIPSFIIGIVILILGVIFIGELFWIDYPFAWVPFSISIIIIAVSILLTIEGYGYFDTKKSYKFSYYFSYYSLTVYLGHNVLFFLFYGQLSIFYFFIAFFITSALMGLALRAIHKRWRSKFSIKVQMGKMAIFLACKLENIDVVALKKEFENSRE
ncbi:MAG: DUF1624 domain-containing protein [Promethearchaeota archaeon]|nr:MAG: DUF1624 domain-containing protein [Candidatus Lokiarchaeota archaeon]